MRLFIQSPGKIVQLPAHVLIANSEKLPNVLRAHRAHGFHHPLDDGTEQFVGVEVDRRARQTRIAAVEHAGAKAMEAIGGAGEEVTYNGVGGRFVTRSGQAVQIALDDDFGAIATGYGRAVSDGWESSDLHCLAP